MEMIDSLALAIVSCFPADSQVSPTNVALFLWFLIWAVAMIVLGGLAIYFLVYKLGGEQVDYRSTWR